MSVTTVTSAGTQSVSISGAQNNKITNLSIPVANTEVSHGLTASLKQVIIRAREVVELKIAFTATESGTKYLTIPKNASLELINLDFSSTTLYVQSPVGSITVEILELY